jgi:alpha-tubulin suppressor-like RCC1 family protein
MSTTNTIPHKRLSIVSAAILVSFLTLLTACDSNPIEKIQSLTEDKYPVANMPDEPLDTPLEINIETKRLAMTSSWSAGVKDDGTLWTWGTGGLLRETKTGQDPTPRQVAGVNDAVVVSGSGGHMLLLRKDGTVWGWGSNSHGEIDPSDDDTFIEELRQIKDIEDVVYIHAGQQASIFVNSKGKLFFLGNNETGVVNGNIQKKFSSPVLVEGFEHIIKAEGSAGAIVALNEDGAIVSSSSTLDSLGNPNAKKIIINDEKIYYPPVIVAFPEKAVDFTKGYANFALLEDGSVWSWRSHKWSAQNESKETFIKSPQEVEGLSKIIRLNSISANSINGDLYTWGNYVYSSESSSTKDYIQKPILIAQNIMVDHYGTGGFADYSFIDDKGNAWMWGDKSDRGQWGIGKITEDYMPKEFVLSLHESLFNTHADK